MLNTKALSASSASTPPSFIASASQQNTVAGASLTINKPTGTLQGDLMIAVLSCRGSSGTWTSPAGWTEIADEGSRPNLSFSYKEAGASEGSSYTFTFSLSAQTPCGCILTYRNGLYDVVSAIVENTDPLVISSVTASANNSILVAAAMRDNSNQTISPATGMTARVTDNDATSNSYVVCDQSINAGSTGTRSFTVGSTNNVSAAMLVIKPK